MDRKRAMGIFGLLSLLLLLQSAPPVSAAGRQAVLARLWKVESGARAVFHAAERGNWPLVSYRVRIITGNWEAYELRAPVDKADRARLDAMMQAIGLLQEKSSPLEKDRLATMKAANDVSMAVLDLIDLYRPVFPTDLERLDVLERQIIVDLSSGDYVGAESTTGTLKAAWGRLRPSVVERGGAGAAATLDAGLVKQERAVSDKSAKAGERQARENRRALSRLKGFFAKHPAGR